MAHWLIARDVPRYVVSRFMGHASTKMLDKVYGRIDERELGDALSRALAQDDLGSSLENQGEKVDGLDVLDDLEALISRGFVRRGGIEPPTRGFSVPCSTD